MGDLGISEPSVLRYRTHPLQVLMKAFEQGRGLRVNTKDFPKIDGFFFDGEDEVNFFGHFGMICSDKSQGDPPNF